MFVCATVYSGPELNPIANPFGFLIDTEFWLVVFTLGLAIFTAFLWLETRRMRKDSEQLKEYARASADAAVASAKAATALTETGQRPWLSVKQHLLNRDLIAEATIDLTTAIVNTGATPALNVVSHHFFLISEDKELPTELDYRWTPESGPIPVAICAHSEQEVTVLAAVSDADCARLARGANLFVYGTIAYSDAFGNSHLTEWSSRCDLTAEGSTDFSLTGRHDSMS